MVMKMFRSVTSLPGPTTLSYLSSRAYPDFLVHRSHQRPGMWFSLVPVPQAQGYRSPFVTGLPLRHDAPTCHPHFRRSEALRRSIANRGFVARSRRACPERSRGNPGNASWQMLLAAFRLQATTEDKKSQTPTITKRSTTVQFALRHSTSRQLTVDERFGN
jgi:hypothetical protein